MASNVPAMTEKGLKKKQRKSSVLLIIKRDWALYLLLVIPMIYYLIFHYLPYYGLTLAFKEFNPFVGFLGGDFVGFDIFKQLFKMDQFYYAVRNTLVLNIVALIFSFPCPIIVAIMLNELRNAAFKRVVQSLLYLPYFISWIIIGGMVYQILAKGGVVNNIITALGANPVPFLTNDSWWIFTFIITLIWQSTGYNAIVYLAAITGINPELYEAGIVDGCGRLRLIWNITLPSIKNVIVIMFILAVGNIMNIGFDRAFSLQNPVVSNTADVISTFVYRVGIQNGRYSVATAVGLFQSVIGCILLTAANLLATKLGEDGIW